MRANDDNLRTILSQKETPELTGDFDDRLMTRIHKNSVQMSAEKKYIRLMYSFFAVGLVLGFILSSIIGNVAIDIRDSSFIINKWFLQLPFVGVLLFVFEKLYRTMQFRKDKRNLFDL